MHSSNHYLKAKKLEAQLLQIIEQPHTSRRLCIAIFPAAHEIETPPTFVFGDTLDNDVLHQIREAIINGFQHQITRDFTRHQSFLKMLADQEKEAAQTEAREVAKQMDLFQTKQQGAQVLHHSTGRPVMLDEDGEPIPTTSPF